MPAVPTHSHYPTAGEVIDGKYRIERVLGEGGMGCVARAHHLILRAPVALKFMNPQFMSLPGAVDRFINEGIASKKIRSDHVVPVDDVGKLPSGAPYLVMPCLEGMDLADQLARDGTPGLPIERAVHFTIQILRGLQAAHAAGIVHRDMKPSNCFVVKHEGESDFVRILDFGISKVAQPGGASLTQTNSALGTPLYMSPEQARSPRDVDGRSDLYSVGVILYELLTGQTPFFSESGEFTEILYKLFTADAPPVQSRRPDVPDALASVVHKALSREVDERFDSAAAMAAELAPFADARSSALLARIRGFRPDQAVSMPPPAGMPLPPSMVAFSALDARRETATDVMANRPRTDVMAGPPITQVMADAFRPPYRSEGLLPEDQVARARPEDAAARTQLDSSLRPPRASVAPAGHGSASPAALAELGAAATGTQESLRPARDAAVRAAAAPSDAPPPRSRTWLFAALGAGAVAVAGIAATGVLGAGRSPQTPAAQATQEPTGAPSAAPPVTASPPLPSAVPVAITSASASASAKLASPKPVPHPTPAVPPKPAEPVDPLQMKINK